MFRLVSFIAALAGALGLSAASAAAAPPSVCPGDHLAPAVTPKLELSATPDAAGQAARYGALQYPRGPIRPMQIALTIDDGPSAENHRRVLDILDKHCLKATFFFIGFLVDERPDLVRDTAAHGHVIGTHSQTHPDNMRRLSPARQTAQINDGFQASARALASAPPQQQAALAPFFRFPGLNDSRAMLTYLGQHRIAVLSADFGTDDWKGISAAEIKRRGLKEAAEAHGGMLIVHESRPHTVEALDSLITSFEQRGYSFVQLVPAAGARAQAIAAPGAALLTTPHPGGRTG